MNGGGGRKKVTRWICFLRKGMIDENKNEGVKQGRGVRVQRVIKGHSFGSSLNPFTIRS